MTEFLNLEALVSLIILASSGMASLAGLIMMCRVVKVTPDLDIDEMVRNAPYHLLKKRGFTITEPRSAE